CTQTQSATPLQSFLGGIGLVLPAHALLVLNGKVFGISGFMHRCLRGDKEAVAGVAGLMAGGAVVGLIDRAGPSPITLPLSLVALSGGLVGLGTKLANGCTSGHMVCGLSRLSIRSLAATCTFFLTGVMTTRVLHGAAGGVLSVDTDWSLSLHGYSLLAAQLVPLAFIAAAYLNSNTLTFVQDAPSDEDKRTPRLTSRLLAAFTTAVDFALALRLSNLVDPQKVLSFLVLPRVVRNIVDAPLRAIGLVSASATRPFDPSLAFLAAGALPLGMALYRFFRGPEVPRLGGQWSIPKGGKVDARLIVGAAIFGVGWGMVGICPGPALVNLGRALSSRSDLSPLLVWLSTFIIGGLIAPA
ncbi:hypothetical protein K525DRAFT_188390, partial [Schizophyllum commune Loenen D]